MNVTESVPEGVKHEPKFMQAGFGASSTFKTRKGPVHLVVTRTC